MCAIGIGELSKRTGVKIETVRWYERVKLLPAPVRTPSRRRRYAENDVARLRFIRRARELGFSLDQVRTLLRLAGDGRNPCPDARALAAAHLAAVRGKIMVLHAMECTLARTVNRCSRGKPAVCALLETLSTCA